ncbi:MAG TPA: ankyrin repeat domain-containing protein [Acidobacteriota bacterium]|nr:ankyrin repeat domain-containing protein [Acidobacteriota bacterium]
MVSFKNYIWLVCLLVLSIEVQASDVDIFTAAEQGDFEVVKKLVQENPQLVTATDDQGYSPLHKAAYNNHLNVVEYLISQGADVNSASGSGSTPLHGAAYYGHPEIVRVLLDGGAECDVVNAGGYTPLLSAAAGNHGEIVRLLVNMGANVNASPSGGRSPLYQAVWNADAELTRFLLDKGAEANIQTEMGVSLPYFASAFRDREFGLMFIHKVTDFEEKDALGLSMLHYSAARGLAEHVQMLLERGVEVDAKDSLGRSPLFYATLWGHDEVVDILKGRGASTDNLEQEWFKGDYLGRPAPGKTPVEFVGDELRTPFAPHGQIAFSPDGSEMLWCHQAMPIQAMWYSRQVNGMWHKPMIAPFTDPALDYADGSPCFSADGNRIYYHTHRPLVETDGRNEDTDIWFVERTDEGWGSPIPLGPPVNTDKNELSPMIAPSGNLYFIGSEYEDTYGAGDIYLSEFVNGVYTTPRNLGPAINSEYYELTPVVPSDESYIVFASDRPNRYQRHLPLFVTFKKDDGSWTNAVSLGGTISPGRAWQPFITADDKFIFYQQGTSYYWLSTALIEDIREAMIGPDHLEVAAPVPVLRKSEQIFEHAATNDIALGDLDGDGDLDAVFSNMGFNDSRVYLNDGHGYFTATDQLLTRQGHGVDLGDLDDDGDLDIFITCAGYGVNNIEYDRPSRIYLNDGRANFTVSPQDLGDSLLSGNNVQLFDIDIDGDLDAMIVYYQEDNGIYLNNGQGRFTRSEMTFPTGANWADLDGDGDVDILDREAGVGFKTLLNDGTGHLIEHWSKSDSGLNRGGVGFGDMDEDGDLDAVVAFMDQSEHRCSSLWYNDGTGRFKESDVRLPLTRNARLATGDLNGDGHPDVFLNNLGLPSAVWLNDGKGGLFDSGIRLPGEWKNTYCCLGDLDGDGDLDVFIAAFLGGPNEIWFNEQ